MEIEKNKKNEKNKENKETKTTNPHLMKYFGNFLMGLSGTIISIPWYEWKQMTASYQIRW